MEGMCARHRHACRPLGECSSQALLALLRQVRARAPQDEPPHSQKRIQHPCSQRGARCFRAKGHPRGIGVVRGAPDRGRALVRAKKAAKQGQSCSRPPPPVSRVYIMSFCGVEEDECGPSSTLARCTETLHVQRKRGARVRAIAPGKRICAGSAARSENQAR